MLNRIKQMYHRVLNKIRTQPSESADVESSVQEEKTEETTAHGTPDQSVKKQPKKRSKKALIILALVIILGLLATPVVLVGLHTLSTAKILQSQANKAETQARGIADQLKAQNLPLAEEGVKELSKTVDTMQTTYSTLEIYSSIPFAKEYYKDGEHIFNAAQAAVAAAEQGITTISPYTELLGFAGEGTFTGGTAENRVRIILDTVEEITPELEKIREHLDTVESELNQVDPLAYPEEVQGIAVRSQLVEAKAGLEAARIGFETFLPVVQQLPSAAGGTDEGRKKYLVLFQNDNELRPSGGFLTAYSVITIEDGKVQPEKSDDIYELDKKFRQRIEIPEALGKYLTTEQYWNLRDMNTSPDFRTSMEQFYEHYKDVPGEPGDIDGIVAIDTHFLVKMMEVLGPVEVPGYGTFSAENTPACDCPQIIYALSEIITRPTPYIRENRKGVIGPLMSALLNKAYSSEDDVWPDLFAQGIESVQRRHVQFYFLDEAPQLAAENAQAAGRMVVPEENTDFLAIVNANLGGAKSNLFTEYEVTQTVGAPTDGKLEKTVEITYKNTRKADNCNLEAGLLCLNSTLQDWTRLYVPAGSELIEAQGLSEEVTTYEEAGFTVIDGFFTLEPLGTAKLRFTYTVPYSNQEIYNGTVWKQGGIESYPLLMDVTGGQEKLEVTGLTEYSTPF